MASDRQSCWFSMPAKLTAGYPFAEVDKHESMCYAINAPDGTFINIPNSARFSALFIVSVFANYSNVIPASILTLCDAVADSTRLQT